MQVTRAPTRFQPATALTEVDLSAEVVRDEKLASSAARLRTLNAAAAAKRPSARLLPQSELPDVDIDDHRAGRYSWYASTQQ